MEEFLQSTLQDDILYENSRDASVKRELQPYNRTRSTTQSVHLTGARPWSSRILLKEQDITRELAVQIEEEMMTQSSRSTILNGDPEVEAAQYADKNHQDEDLPSLEISLKPHSIVLSPRRRDFTTVGDL
jgi:hypothetical protein